MSRPSVADPARDSAPLGDGASDRSAPAATPSGAAPPVAAPPDGSAPDDGPANPYWRYGVYLFPLAPLSMLFGYANVVLLGLGAETESVGVLIFAFAGLVLAGWGSVLFAALVAVALVLDALALRDHPDWAPNPWLAAGASLLHFAGAFLAAPYLLSTPAIAYYVYKRRQYVGSDDGRDEDEA